MIRKSVQRFSGKIMLKQKIERDDDSKKSHPALGPPRPMRTGLRRFSSLPPFAMAVALG
jgi:hypothetical protein